MAAVESLCPLCILIQSGKITEIGMSSVVISRYVSSIVHHGLAVPLKDRTDRTGSGQIRFTYVKLLNKLGQEVTQIEMGSFLTIEVGFQVFEPVSDPIFSFLIVDEVGKTVVRAHSRESYAGSFPRLTKSGVIRCHFNELNLMYGKYGLRLWAAHHRNNKLDDIEWAASFEVLQKDVYGTCIPPDAYNGGVFFTRHSWEIIL